MQNKQRLKCFVPFAVLVAGLVILYTHGLSNHDTVSMTKQLWSSEPSTVPSLTPVLQKQQCDDVLHKMMIGRWYQNTMTSEEVEIMRRFHKRVREEEHHMPKGMQRADNKCGNVNQGSKGTLTWFRGMCDPEGATPCCLGSTHQCANRTVQQCAPPACPDCFDMRTPIQAEYATWRPVHAACQPRSRWSVGEVCGLLGPGQSSLIFVGDSFVRHVYTALLLAVRGDEFTGAYKKNIPKDLRVRCRGIYMFTEKVCRLWLDWNVTACGGTVRLSLHKPRAVRDFEKSVRDLVLNLANSTRRSLVYMGVGFHDGLDPGPMKRNVLGPLLKILDESRVTAWPKFLWASVHKFGILRAPHYVNAVRALAYNRDVNAFLRARDVDVFDAYNLTDNVMSFDGQHFGLGVNRMKVRIFLHYLQQLRDHGQW